MKNSKFLKGANTLFTTIFGLSILGEIVYYIGKLIAIYF